MGIDMSLAHTSCGQSCFHSIFVGSNSLSHVHKRIYPRKNHIIEAE